MKLKTKLIIFLSTITLSLIHIYALKFTKEGGITLRAALENGQLHFSISDTGCGISQEEQQRIFQEFTRLHNAQGQEGFGLGLAITRKLVLLLEGDIKI